MIDSHCHLNHEPLLSNITNVIQRSKKVGIEKILTICTTQESYESILKILNIDEIIYGTYGIHPHETSNNIISTEEIITNIRRNKKIIGIGETGLDFYYENSDKKSQINSFINHLEAAITLKFPVIIHSRNAENEMFEIINRYKDKDLKILMHCFTGSYEFTQKLLNFDVYFSASGIITFKNSKDLQGTFKKIPQDKLLIETDSPFLTPVPLRGKKNEPSYITYTLEKLSELKEISVQNLDSITTKNFNRLFNL